ASHITLSGPGIPPKGGRERIVPILEQHRSVLIELREQGLAHPDGHLFQHRQSLTNAVKRAASALVTKLGIAVGDGSHSFRKCYANELYQHLVAIDGMSPDEARRAVTQALGHN